MYVYFKNIAKFYFFADHEIIKFIINFGATSFPSRWPFDLYKLPMLCGKMLKITFLLLLVFLGSSGEYVKAFLSSKPVTLSAMTSSSSLISKAVKEASFGMGCFWEPAEQVKKVEGVIDTVSGYTGNKQFDDDPTKKLPSYENVCYGRQWVEAVS